MGIGKKTNIGRCVKPNRSHKLLPKHLWNLHPDVTREVISGRRGVIQTGAEWEATPSGLVLGPTLNTFFYTETDSLPQPQDPPGWTLWAYGWHVVPGSSPDANPCIITLDGTTGGSGGTANRVGFEGDFYQWRGSHFDQFTLYGAEDDGAHQDIPVVLLAVRLRPSLNKVELVIIDSKLNTSVYESPVTYTGSFLDDPGRFDFTAGRGAQICGWIERGLSNGDLMELATNPHALFEGPKQFAFTDGYEHEFLSVKRRIYGMPVKGITFSDVGGQWVNIGDVFSYANDVPWSIGCWFNITDSVDERCLISKFGASGSRSFLFETLKTTRTLVLEDNSGLKRVATTVGVDLNTWYAAVLTHDGAQNMALYLFDANGNLLDTDTGSVYTHNTSAEPVRLGNRNLAGDNMEGELAHCFTVAGKISNAEEAKKFALDPPKAVYEYGEVHGPVFYLPLRGGSDFEPDTSGKDNHGVLEGAATTAGTTLPKRFGKYTPELLHIAKDNVLPDDELPAGLRKFGKFETPWTKKPPAGTKIDMAHPLAQGLISFFPLDHPYQNDIITPRELTVIDEPLSSTGERGRNTLFDNSSSNRIEYVRDNNSLSTNDLNNWTVITWSKYTDTDDAPAYDLVSQWDYAAVYRHFTMTGPHSTGNLSFFEVGYGTGGATINTGEVGPALNDGKWHMHVGTVAIEGGSLVIRLYVDGVEEGSQSIGSTMRNATSANWVIGGQDSSTANTYTGNIQDVSFYRGRTLTQAEILELYKNQWQIFKPQTHFIAREGTEHEFLPIKRPRTKQPLAGTEVKRKWKPAFVTSLGTYVEYEQGQKASLFGTSPDVVSVATQYGKALDGGGIGATDFISEYDPGRWNEWAAIGECTWLLRVWFQNDAGGTFGNFLRFGNGTGGRFKIQQDSATNDFKLYFDTQSTASGITLVDGTWYDLWVTWKQADNTARLTVINLETGDEETGITGAGVGAVSIGATDNLGVGRSTNTGIGDTPNGKYNFLGFFNRQFSAKELTEISKDLYGELFEPELLHIAKEDVLPDDELPVEERKFGTFKTTRKKQP